MLLLPTFNAVLLPCAVGPEAFRAHAQGHFCDSCQRVVQDFSQSANPVAELAAARAAAPDGRVCGSFRAAQVQQMPPPLTRRLKWFLMALVLVVGQGLTAREALAQVRRTTIDYTQQVAKPERERLAEAKRDSLMRNSLILDETNLPPFLGMVVEQVPRFRGGGTSSLVKYIQQHIKWPSHADTVHVRGRLFISFTVGEDGLVHNAKVVKGLHPLFDDEALRVVRSLTGFEPAKQNGKPVSMGLTLPITFESK
ncbi:energy transducer TonB [Hymenobacter artigasi]|uniref:Protein TonB n=1 Tax=Hymenobacter artigasi TaxID=2719616 RepID=A0ABX1HMF6_9BACT|nr:energy transducer TonB [Hymenobacter artigasi]NKI91434.1 protein TonB [Hymenobacter artigasi]